MKTVFKFSSSKLSQIPDHGKPEFAFIGRSNVGKSSLINMLSESKLAKVSATPGKTKLINHFLVDEKWWLVDLPGYGYARTSQTVRKQLFAMPSSVSLTLRASSFLLHRIVRAPEVFHSLTRSLMRAAQSSSGLLI